MLGCFIVVGDRGFRLRIVCGVLDDFWWVWGV